MIGAERPRIVLGDPDQANMRNPPGYDFIVLLLMPSRPRGLAKRSCSARLASTIGWNFVLSHMSKSVSDGCIIICDTGRTAM